SFNYKKAEPTIPEIGICLDFLNHMAINRKGKVSICVRFDPKGLGIIGDANSQDLVDIWNGDLRMKWMGAHREGRRKDVPLCSYCHFWGVPTANDLKINNDIKKIGLNEVLSKQRRSKNAEK
ncbi:MAG: SPASM domain-containing protein, partial [Candidatus Omnitrophota bacterium]